MAATGHGTQYRMALALNAVAAFGIGPWDTSTAAAVEDASRVV